MMELPSLGEQQFLPMQNPAKQFLALSKPEKPELSPLKKQGIPLEKQDQESQLRKVAEDFEAVFIAQMMKQMRSTIHKEEMMHGGAGEDVFTEMMDQEMAQKMAKRGSAGIADMLYKQLSRQYGIGESDQEGAMPGLSETSGALQQKLQGVQNQVRQQDLQQLSPDL